MKKLNIWFEGDTLCIEFDGEYERGAQWYRPLMTRIRMELGANDPGSPQGWVRGGGGAHNAVWRMHLANDALRTPLDAQQAYNAVVRAVQAFNSYPHSLGLIMETL